MSADEDLKRSREYSDAFRKYIAAASTGGIGILFAAASSFAEKGIEPRWVVSPIISLTITLLLIAVALLLGEHRSLLRRRNPKAQATLPWWKMGVTWNLIPLIGFAVSVVLAVIALNNVHFAKSGDENGSVSKERRSSVNRTLWLCCSAPASAAHDSYMYPPSRYECRE